MGVREDEVGWSVWLMPPTDPPSASIAQQPAAATANIGNQVPAPSDTGRRATIRLGLISEIVQLPDGPPVTGAVALVAPADSAVLTRRRQTTTDALGRLTFDSLPFGMYRIHLTYGAAAPFVLPITID